MTIIIIASVIIAGLFLLYFGFLLPGKSVSAKVILKDVWGGDDRGLSAMRIYPVVASYRVTFEIAAYENVTLLVPGKKYNEIVVSDTGILKYDPISKKFRSFVKNAA
ncbi:hypothetical protein FACS1894219_00910 [Clostridia bacterium]|nr:hypothetical protein FACS1894219_00910 [Clostridia bacterium]